MTRLGYLILIFCFGAVKGLSQAPVIQKVEPLVTFPNDTIVISGNGFSDNPAELQVWFGGVKGTIVASSVYGIEVVVPPQAAVSNIEVRNLATRLSARSQRKFLPSYHGTGFNVSKFSDALEKPSVHELFDLCACDLNNDGKPDIAVTKFLRTASKRFPDPTDIMILRNESTPGTLDFETQSVVLNIGTDHVICGDLEGDGKPDLIVSRSGSPRNSIHILKNTTATAGGEISFKLPPTDLLLDPGHFATRMSLFDLNRDGLSDIVVTNSSNDVLYVFTNTSTGGTLTFNQTPLKLSIKTDSNNPVAYEADVQDFNGDNLPDVVIGTFQSSDIYMFENISTGTMNFAAPVKFELPGSFNKMMSYNFGGSELPDLAITSTLNNKTVILINESTGDTFSFSDPVELNATAEPWGIDGGDIDGDGDADFAVANKKLSATPSEVDINIFLNSGTGGAAFTKNDLSTEIPTRNVRVLDFDGDGKPDIAYTAFDETQGSSRAFLGVQRNENCHLPEVLNGNDLDICAGQTIKLQTIPLPNINYAWTRNGVAIGGNTASLNITQEGTYKVTATSEGGACQVASEDVVVTLGTGAAPNVPSIDPPDPVCTGEELTITTDAVPSATYLWTGPNGFTADTQDLSFTASADDAGEYTLQVQVGVCKSNPASVRVDVVDFADFKINANSASDILCNGSSVTLSVNNLADHSFSWKKDDVVINPAQTNATLNVSQSGSYSVVVTNDVLECSSETAPVEFTFVSPAVAGFSVENGCIGENLSFNDESTGINPEVTPVYSWTFGDTQTSTQTEPTHAYSTAGPFTATLTITYQGVTGCASNVASRNLTVFAPVVPEITSEGDLTAACPQEEIALSVAEGFATMLWSNGGTERSITVSPGTYTINTVDANGCAGEAEFVIIALEAPNMTATATPATIAIGQESQLEATPADLQEYTWTPVETLSDPAIANPLATPSETTTYIVTGIHANGCSGEAQVTITVEGIAGFPAGFSPNGDAVNDRWDIKADRNPDCTVSIYDGGGKKVFEGKGENWDGTYQGKAVQEGTYYFVYSCPGEKSRTGNLLLFR